MEHDLNLTSFCPDDCLSNHSRIVISPDQNAFFSLSNAVLKLSSLVLEASGIVLNPLGTLFYAAEGIASAYVSDCKILTNGWGPGPTYIYSTQTGTLFENITIVNSKFEYDSSVLKTSISNNHQSCSECWRGKELQEIGRDAGTKLTLMTSIFNKSRLNIENFYELNLYDNHLYTSTIKITTPRAQAGIINITRSQLFQSGINVEPPTLESADTITIIVNELFAHGFPSNNIEFISQLSTSFGGRPYGGIVVCIQNSILKGGARSIGNSLARLEGLNIKIINTTFKNSPGINIASLAFQCTIAAFLIVRYSSEIILNNLQCLVHSLKLTILKTVPFCLFS